MIKLRGKLKYYQLTYTTNSYNFFFGTIYGIIIIVNIRSDGDISYDIR